MKLIDIVILASLSGCNLMPFVVEEADELIEFEIEANKDEFERRQKTQIQPLQNDQRSQRTHEPDNNVGASGAPA